MMVTAGELWQSNVAGPRVPSRYWVFSPGDGVAEPSCFPCGDSSAFCCLAGPQSKVSRCQPNEHNCLGTELCIHMSKLCNGLHDCFDGSDEGPHCRGRCLGGMVVKEGLRVGGLPHEILPLPPFLPCHGKSHEVPVCPWFLAVWCEPHVGFNGFAALPPRSMLPSPGRAQPARGSSAPGWPVADPEISQSRLQVKCPSFLSLQAIK